MAHLRRPHQNDIHMHLGDRKPLDQEIDVFGLTDTGKVRSENQDQFLICALQKRIELHGTSLDDEERLAGLASNRLGFLALVADGVGGSAAGQEASKTAIEGVLEYVGDSMQCFYTEDPEHEESFLGALHESVMLSHEKIKAKAEEDPDRRGMATTLTMVMSVWPRAYVVQVGDSRCYQVRDGNLRRITRDQTLAQDLYDEGALNTMEAEESPWAHMLMSAVGGSVADPVTTTIDMQWDDVLMLCTDGLTKHMPDDEIEERLGNLESAEQTCRELVETALARGGTDNVTAVIGRLRSPA
jgi:serine/threonine protein phosphatase PrpC